MKNNYIVDSHCHLDLIEEKNIKLEEVLKYAKERNVQVIQTICTKISEFDKILSYTKKHDFIYCSFGIHPCNVQNEPEISSKQIINICNKNDKIIGIGETGLDYFHNTEFVPKQKKSFIEHINASKDTSLPLIIHNRNSDEDMISILKSEMKEKDFPALLHCFSSSKELAYSALDLGLYISISGIVTFKNAKILQEIVKDIPVERLLIETDSPYLAPEPHRGSINQPGNCSYVVDFIAKLKNISSEEVMNITTNNFFKLFTKAKFIEGN